LPSFWAVALQAGILAGGSLPGNALAETLRWKLKAGEQLRYTVEEKTVLSTKVMGRDIKSTRSHTVNLSWNVKSVAENGDADVGLRFDRVRMHVEQPPITLDFDSASDKIEAPEPFGSMGRQIKAMAGVEFTFRMKPTGAIEDVQVPEATLRSLRAGLDGDSGGAAMFSEQGVKDILVHSSPPPFPEGALEPGKSWSGKPARIPTPLGTMVMDKIFTFQGPDPKSAKLMSIGTETKVSLEPAENATVSGKIMATEGRGSLVFDADAGRIVSSRLTQKVEMQLSGPAEQRIEQTETSSRMTLEQ
jgi:hypothetical protein